ncbi:lytic murein transglycosylase [Brucella pseudogrignonensis]|uniref:Lytic murein transglycosylase n=1 Tax=Brucella pseudogrignonensis TaxID=419475 RepID=A0ABU1MDK6_9HYPH|nr:lytic murein transglycosylase [Brucella pseudogrignonensis]MDR6434122.1 lytic murein transglycosylase [Brucella pseudogrignonensis]
MALFAKGRTWTAAAVLAVSMMAGTSIVEAAQCGNNGAGYNAWLQQTVKEAQSRGIGNRAINALKNTKYAQATINADRNQKSFKLTFEQFMQKRGANTIIQRGKSIKKQNAALFAAIEKRYGVPAGPLIAIWGMETGFGAYLGKQHTLSAVATLAYDCRRSDYFTQQLYAALKLIDNQDLDPNAVGAMHGEIGQTQFLPVNVLKYGVDGDGSGHIDMARSKADALYSTANFLVGHGWKRGAGFQPGEPNYGAIQGWNAAQVYQRAIAVMGKAIDE